MGPQRRDLLIRNAKTYTVDDQMPWAEAVLIRGDRIAWVGADADARDHANRGADELDAGGRLVLPGFVDSHNHIRLGANPLAVDLSGAASLDELRARIAEHARTHPDHPWIEGSGWNYSAMPGGRRPTWRDLEGVTDGSPAFLLSYDVHTVWMNRETMAAFRIGSDVDRVPFGRVERDPTSGEPTGFVTGFAIDGISRRGQDALREVVPGYADETQYRRLVDSLDMAIGFGITTIVEPQNSIDDLALFERARGEGRLRSRLVAALFHPPGTTSGELDEFERARSLYDDDRLRVAPIKLYIDDVIEPRTAALLDDYSDLPGHRGDTFWERHAFAELIVELERRGFQTFTHATGDRGIRTALDAIEHARTVHGGLGLRHQIVHVECLAPEDIPRFADLDVVACMQPRHCAPEISADWRRHVGPARWRRAWAFRSLYDAGATLAFSSDWNVAEMDPMVGIYTALTRASLDGSEAWIPEETLDLETTIRAYTMGGAYANHCEADRGSITRGKYADLVVVSDDLFSLPPSGVLGTRVELAVVGGEIAYRTEAFA